MIITSYLGFHLCKVYLCSRLIVEYFRTLIGNNSKHAQFDEVFSTGSGAIFDSKDGLVHIVTNNHVVEDASKIRVVFANG